MTNAEWKREGPLFTAFILHSAFITLHLLQSLWWNGDHASVRSSRSRFDSWRGQSGGAGGVGFGLVSVRVSTAPCHGVRTGSSPVRGAGRIFGLIWPMMIVYSTVTHQETLSMTPFRSSRLRLSPLSTGSSRLSCRRGLSCSC